MTDSLLLSPVAYEDFIKSYRESQPLHISRKESNHFSRLLSVEGIKKYVTDNTAIHPDVLVVNSRSPVKTSDYTNDLKHVDAVKLFQHHERGGTVVVNEVHKKFAPVGELCAQVNRDFQLRCQANAYLSPPGNQGFHSHYDTHDVFVLQLAGRKTFRFYPSDIELPFPDDTFHPDAVTGAEPVEQVELSAGDTLYIPRGIVHDALASEDEPSLHITLGVYPYVVRDLLQEMIQVAAERDVNLRRSVDLNSATEAPAVLKKLFEEFFTEEVYEEAVSRLADEAAVDCYRAPDSTVDEAEAEFTAGTVVMVNHAAIHGSEHRDGVFKLRLAGQVIQFSEPYNHAVEELLKAEKVTVGSLPGLDEEQQLALCHQLVTAGVVDIC